MKVGTKFKILSLCTIFFVALGIYYFRISGIILDVGDTYAEAGLTTATYASLYGIFTGDTPVYEDFFSIARDEEGKVAYLVTDGVTVNAFTSKVSAAVLEYLNEYAKKGVDVPAGVFSGVRLFAGFGKNVNFKLLKISSVRCDLVSDFKAEGINQVRHSLYLKIVPEVTLKAAGRSKRVNTDVSVLLFENVIVGNVPDTYLNITANH